ncbi:hypothetical protein BCIN_13g02340 [Botrytis cinerea B05.10]|uniref:Uncharacterized protein n=2 Tax=Botryotinia fuckeliana TaxID=40559 RepID=A0A384K0N4_BOTFB|nr:hypothetical protein BCIN_13g02340 [Botrytis cinerea B05.10]ATZ56395.1 hypothetical protein BCIN_13g02340 [Botrytis cinerea B05.10]EMR88294.1 hypothetical protein BcDW1_3089 [Botrytis cinerea BcDW1]
MSPWLVKKEDRYKYGLMNQEIIATNQRAETVLVTGLAHDPSWSSIKKSIAAVHTQDDEKFVQCFQKDLRVPLKELLVSSLPNCSWTLNVFHLGFGADKYANPIVIHVCVQTPRYFKDNEDAALGVVQGMENIIKEKIDNQNLAKFNIDICHINPSMRNVNPHGYTELRSDESSKVPRVDPRKFPGVNLICNFPSIYFDYTPCPGFSIGREKTKDKIYPAGSLTGFLRQENTIYSLTCSHVVFPDLERPSERYKYKDGMEQFKISIPAYKDHQATIQAMESKLYYAGYAINHIENRQIMSPAVDFSSKMRHQKERQILFATDFKEAEDYNTHAGYVYAASEEWRKVASFNGILDWALIRNASVDPRNQLPWCCFLGEPQVFEFIEKFGDKYWSSGEREAFINKCLALQSSVEFNISHPKSFSLFNEKSIYFKAASRTTGWKACELNSIPAIIHNQNATSDEHVFISDDTLEAQEEISGGGDSGALIYAIDVDDGKQTVLVPMAMIWGGSKHSFKGDVTYATPIEEVFKDIESEMGWEHGSLKFF